MTQISGHYNAIADVSSKFKPPATVKANDGQVNLSGSTSAAVIADLESEIKTHDKVVVHQGGKAVELSKDEATKLLADLKAHKVDLAGVKLEVNEEGALAYAEHLLHELGHAAEHGAHAAHYPHMAAELVEILSHHGIQEGIGKLMGKVGGQVFGKAMVGLGVVIGGEQAIDYGKRFMKSLETGDGNEAYNAMQCLLGVGTAVPGPLGWSCAAVSDMLKASEGKGMFKEVVLDNAGKLAAEYNMYNVASRSQMSWAVDNGIFNGGDGRDTGSANLEKVQGGFKDEAAALKYIKEQQQSAGQTVGDRRDYAITREADGSFTVNNITGQGLTIDDISNQDELTSINLKKNQANVVGIVADDGSYGRAEQRTLYDGSTTWDVNYARNILDD